MELTAAGQEAIWRRFLGNNKAARREVVKGIRYDEPDGWLIKRPNTPYKIMDKRSAVALFHGRVKRLHQNAKTYDEAKANFGENSQ
jgi:hypothetical protein